MLKKLGIDKETLRKFIIVCITSEFIYFVYAAKNVAATISTKLMGAVSNSCSVFCLRSSQNSFMVRSGIRMMNKNRSIKK